MRGFASYELSSAKNKRLSISDSLLPAGADFFTGWIPSAAHMDPKTGNFDGGQPSQQKDRRNGDPMQQQIFHHSQESSPPLSLLDSVHFL